jgi:uncharacterized cupredoxin-like copper-binding protein
MAPPLRTDCPSAARGLCGTLGDKGIGEPGKAGQVSRTINVDMTDNMRFTPAEISVRQGETVRFVVRNLGAAKHEVVLASPAELK